MANRPRSLVPISTSSPLLVQPLHQQINGSYNNQAGGDINIIQPVNPLGEFLKALDLPAEETAELLEIADELQRYFRERDVIGLEAKLVQAGRQDLIPEATEGKHDFSMKLARLQFSLQLRQVYHHILAMLVHRFKRSVLPLILSGAPSADVDAAIMNIASEVYGYTSASIRLNLTEPEIYAMIFFLTGNCHIKWSR